MTEPRPATLQLATPAGIWRQAHARRQALHAAAAQHALAAWRADTRGLDLEPAARAVLAATGPMESADPGRAHRRDIAAAAVLDLLARRTWRRTRRALAAAIAQAYAAGRQAGHHLATRDHSDDTPWDDAAPGPGMSDHDTAGTITATLTAAVAAAARRAGRHMSDTLDDDPGDPTDAADLADQAIDDGADLTAATDVAVSAAYGAGLLAAYLQAGARSVTWTTAGDGRVCPTCATNEDGSPYSLLAAPRLPAHPSCRCVLTPN